MFQGLHLSGQQYGLRSMLRLADRPDRFRFRLGNSLLIRLSDVTGSFDQGDNVEGASSTDTGTVARVKDVQGETIVKLSDIGESEVFEIGETLDDTTGDGSGTIRNGVMNLSSLSIASFQRNETIEGQSSGATAEIDGIYGQMVSVVSVTGTFTGGETVKGSVTGAEALMEDIYAGVPGLFKDDTISGIIGEPDSVSYEPHESSVSDTNSTWPTEKQDLSNNWYMLSKVATFVADDTAIGPVNTIIVTADWDDQDEIMISSSPLKDTPPSEVISVGTTLNVQHRMSLD